MKKIVGDINNEAHKEALYNISFGYGKDALKYALEFSKDELEAGYDLLKQGYEAGTSFDLNDTDSVEIYRQNKGKRYDLYEFIHSDEKCIFFIIKHKPICKPIKVEEEEQCQ